jgi:hypothetical protein
MEICEFVISLKSLEKKREKIFPKKFNFEFHREIRVVIRNFINIAAVRISCNRLILNLNEKIRKRVFNETLVWK